MFMLDFCIETFLTVCHAMNFTKATYHTTCCIETHWNIRKIFWCKAVSISLQTMIFYRGRKASSTHNHDIFHLRAAMQQISASYCLYFGVNHRGVYYETVAWLIKNAAKYIASYDYI